jgi:hypothetical protein
MKCTSLISFYIEYNVVVRKIIFVFSVKVVLRTQYIRCTPYYYILPLFKINNLGLFIFRCEGDFTKYILVFLWTKKKQYYWLAVNETVAAWGGENVLHVMRAANATTYTTCTPSAPLTVYPNTTRPFHPRAVPRGPGNLSSDPPHLTALLQRAIPTPPLYPHPSSHHSH